MFPVVIFYVYDEGLCMYLSIGRVFTLLMVVMGLLRFLMKALVIAIYVRYKDNVAGEKKYVR